jgi:hypothetical protein
MRKFSTGRFDGQDCHAGGDMKGLGQFKSFEPKMTKKAL